MVYPLMYSWNLACNPCCGCTFNECPLCWQAIWHIQKALQMALSNIIGDVMVVEMNYCASVLLYEFKFSPVNSVWLNYTILLQFSDIINNCLLLQLCRGLAPILEPVGIMGTMVLGVVACLVMTMKICHHHPTHSGRVDGYAHWRATYYGRGYAHHCVASRPGQISAPGCRAKLIQWFQGVPGYQTTYFHGG